MKTALLILITLILGSATRVPKLSRNQTLTNDMIARALSAAPPAIAAHATVVDVDQHANTILLRKGTNSFVCRPGRPGVVGDNPLCEDVNAAQWEQDFMDHKPKPTHAQPGIEYMLAGGTDWSASDPNASSGTPIHEPPHWMVLWPFDPKTTGFPTHPKQQGTWIMWAGTPWAHLMINQRP